MRCASYRLVMLKLESNELANTSLYGGKLKMKNHMWQWAYSETREQQHQVLNDLLTTTAAHSLTITDPDQIGISPQVARSYIRSAVTDIGSLAIPPKGHQAPSAVEWLEEVRTPERVQVKFVDGQVKVETQVDPVAVFAKGFRDIIKAADQYKTCEVCDEIISTVTPGRWKKKYCSDFCRGRNYRQRNKTEK